MLALIDAITYITFMLTTNIDADYFLIYVHAISATLLTYFEMPSYILVKYR